MRCPLHLSPLGQWGEVTVVDVKGPCRLTLQGVGLSVGQRFRRVSSLPWGGPVVVQVGHALVAVDAQLARRIRVHCSKGMSVI